MSLEKVLKSLIILVSWELRKHRNGIVFNGTRPGISEVLLTVKNENALWCITGDTLLRELLLRSLGYPQVIKSTYKVVCSQTT
jgi:hypothetical protein